MGRQPMRCRDHGLERITLPKGRQSERDLENLSMMMQLSRVRDFDFGHDCGYPMVRKRGLEYLSRVIQWSDDAVIVADVVGVSVGADADAAAGVGVVAVSRHYERLFQV